MLDFYLTNAPLHLVAQENPEDEIADWRIRVTINGESFVLDRWQPIYLKGFKPGKNWVQLEFLDEQGNSVKNVFNDTVRLINYEPKGKDTLSKLVRGELSVEAARGIVDPNYKNQPTPPPTPAPEETPAVSPSATETPTPTPSVTPTTEATPTPEPEVEQSPESAPTPDQQTKKPKSGFFGLFRRPTESPSPSPEPTVPEEPEQTLEPEASPTPTESPTLKEEPTPATEVAPTPAISPVPIPIEPEKPRFGGFFNRFRRPEPIPSGSPNLPETLETPASAPTVPEEPEQTPESEALPTPTESPAFKEESTPATEVAPTPAISPVPIPIEPEKPGFGGFFNRFRRPVPTPSLSPKLPEELETPSSKPTVPGLPETKVETPAPEASDIPSNLRTPVEEPTPILKSVTPKAESSPVIKSVPNQPEKPKADDLQKLIQPPTIEEAAPESGLPPTLPEIIESPLRQSSGAETTPIPKSLTEKEQAASSEPPETAEAESAPAKPKLDLKEVLLSPPSPAPSPRIIQAPANPQSDIPARFLKKSVTDDSTNEPESSEAPTAN